MKVTCNIATYPAREQSLKKMLPSVIDQFDEVRVYFNQYPRVPKWVTDMGVKGTVGQDLTDNGKFFFLNVIEEPEIYFTCDDDIIYPENYREYTCKVLEEAGGIVTHHGRVLRGPMRKYYTAHKVYHCLTEVKDQIKLDVCGTGVTAHRTDTIRLNGVAFDSRRKMTDLLVSLEAAHEGVSITCPPHEKGWLKHIHNPSTIHSECLKHDNVQADIANEIYRLKYENQRS